MAMVNSGLSKLIEECAELIVICAKKQAYMDAEIHPDGQNIKDNIEQEVSDVLASITFVKDKLKLSEEKIAERSKLKLGLYEQWDSE